MLPARLSRGFGFVVAICCVLVPVRFDLADLADAEPDTVLLAAGDDSGAEFSASPERSSHLVHALKRAHRARRERIFIDLKASPRTAACRTKLTVPHFTRYPERHSVALVSSPSADDLPA